MTDKRPRWLRESKSPNLHGTQGDSALVSAANRENGWVNWSGLATFGTRLGNDLIQSVRSLLALPAGRNAPA